MREILFRGKRLDNGEWVVGYLYKRIVHLSGFHQNLVVDAIEVSDGENPLGISYYTISPDTVGQHTGLCDKDGKRIFEGDIVRCISMTDMANMVVLFEDGEFRMVLCEKYKDYITGCGFYAIRCFDKEIIGNIHDNPELLKGE